MKQQTMVSFFLQKRQLQLVILVQLPLMTQQHNMPLPILMSSSYLLLVFKYLFDNHEFYYYLDVHMKSKSE